MATALLALRPSGKSQALLLSQGKCCLIQKGWCPILSRAASQDLPFLKYQYYIKYQNILEIFFNKLAITLTTGNAGAASWLKHFVNKE